MAIRDLGLPSWEFWRMTPAEFMLRLEGVDARDDKVWEKLAYGLSAVGTWLTKKRVRMEDVKPKKTQATRRAITAASAKKARAELDKLKDEMGAT